MQHRNLPSLFFNRKLAPLSFAANISALSVNICPDTTALPPVTLSKFKFSALSTILLFSIS